jgi:hypothetical protein
VNASLVVIGGESIQLATEVEAVPEDGLIEILPPKGSDKVLATPGRHSHRGVRRRTHLSGGRSVPLAIPWRERGVLLIDRLATMPIVSVVDLGSLRPCGVLK